MSLLGAMVAAMHERAAKAQARTAGDLVVDRFITSLRILAEPQVSCNVDHGNDPCPGMDGTFTHVQAK